ncbi:hypothetical protein VVD49_05530 [Uliginosibacterium sp. H3]|uniref:Secreted protein n=1 Tax=Uliginosibacterium silvisoli TaxID=3114758 RepID=A0ABU6K0K1_9RHOO|nr:hypothetical protein [Uliginosibacterium sp. H3]
MKKRATGISLCLVVLAAQAAPAPWYQWKSKLNGKIACMQTSPGDGWERDGGPKAQAYPDARCVTNSSSSATTRR